MLLGALLDAGADEAPVREGLASLRVPGLELAVRRTERHGIGAARVEVFAPEDGTHRTWADVRAIVDRAGLPGRARGRAQETFRRLAVAEGHIHGVPAERVHFHEVGGTDAIADVCGVALALESLEIDRVVVSALPVARGFVDAAHGRLPLPAPATLELLQGAPLHGVEGGGELVTPTGAALVAALAEGFGPLPAMTLEGIGYGAGARRTAERPNVVRVLVGRAAEDAPADRRSDVVQVETNLDDLPPELVPDAAAALFAAGALDVWSTPTLMKKGRPGVVLAALARPEREHAVAEALLRETTALGVRIFPAHRWELEREWRHVEVGGTAVRLKLGRLGGEVVTVAPEHDDCAAAAAIAGRPVATVWAEAMAAGQPWVGERA
jgi:hypothetical protein